MSDILEVADQYYVLATSILADHETRVLKQGETFAIFDSYGDVQPITHSESGIFYRGTRHLSRLELLIFGGHRPLLLNSTLRDDNGLLKVDLTNRDQNLDGFFPRGTIYLHREKFLLDARCFEHLEFSNYGTKDVEIDIGLRCEVDFKDIFEVRGQKRPRRGEVKPVVRRQDHLEFEYRGLDEVTRRTRLSVSRADFDFSEAEGLRLKLCVPARGKAEFFVTLSFSSGSDEALLCQSVDRESYFCRLKDIHEGHTSGRQAYCGIKTSNEQFDAWMRRSTDDLVMMTTATDQKFQYPYAGIPWFCAPFGRDGILTALGCLWANPSLAQGVLGYLASTQAQERIPERDATPGKIIHEVRHGEMANLKEIPFGQYYGSIDSTPLFIALAGRYFGRTGDRETIRAHWPAIEKALFWIDRYGDIDQDGFVEYARESANGLVNQGWKDSWDAVFHQDGSDVLGPVALSEVQGYVYLAKVEGAQLAQAMGHLDLARSLQAQAAQLRENFDRAFWLEDLKTFALALDGEKRPCRVKSSNAGQCLFTGIVKRERRDDLVKTLMSPESFSGWGIRTLATSGARYNPMSYHNGSVWPHDVALIAQGLAQYGYKDEVERLFTGLFRSAVYMDQYRMPEVFCGFFRREGEAPTLYPHACSPQAWAAASVYTILQALLGISIDGEMRRVHVRYPRLPDQLDSVTIAGLQVADQTVDLVMQSYKNDVSVQISKRGAKISVVVEK